MAWWLIVPVVALAVVVLTAVCDLTQRKHRDPSQHSRSRATSPTSNGERMSVQAAEPSLCLVAMVKNAAGLIEPWLDYHHALGVGGAVVFLDDPDDDTRDRLRRYEWVTVLDAPARSDARQSLPDRQELLLPRGVAVAKEAGFDWALLIDPDEFLWPHDARTPLAADVLLQGSLPALFARVDPSVEQVRFRSHEAIPVPSATAATFLDNPYVARHPVTRDLVLPDGSGRIRLERFLGHRLGKAGVRTDLDIRPEHVPHRWRHRHGDALRTLSIGCLIHHYAADVDIWQTKFAQHSWQDVRWSHTGTPVPEHIVAWRRWAAQATTDEARRYFDDQVALAPELLAAAMAEDTVVELPVVKRVLDAVGDSTPPVTSSDSSRVVFLAFDACDFERMLELADRGDAPNIAKLQERSYTVPTVGPPGVYVGAIWPDFHTAAHAGHHGRHSWKQIIPGSYDINVAGVPVGLTHPTIYERLVTAGRRVAVVDPPLIPLLDANATQVIEWGSHDPVFGPMSTPVELIDELVDRHGRHPVVENCNSHDRSLERHLALREALIEGARRKTALLLDVYHRFDWDLFVGVYKESHCVGHQMWHVTDPTFPHHDPEITAALGTPIDDVYRILDAQIGEWIETLDERTTLVLWLTHGMGPHTDPTYYLDVILRRLESTRRYHDEWRAAATVLAATPVDTAQRTEAQRRLRAVNDKIWDDVHTRPIDERDFFYLVNNETEGGIRLNLRGREPAGTVAPDARAELVHWIRERLFELTDADTGEELTAEVLDLHQHYPGPLTHHLPDLAVLWNRPQRLVEAVASPFLNGAQRLPYRGTRSGDHHPRGVAFIAGPGQGRGHHEVVVRSGELGATVARLAGLAPGRTVYEAIELPRPGGRLTPPATRFVD